MKILFTCLSTTLAVLILSSCANGEKLQENAPVAFQEAYFTAVASVDSGHTPGIKFVLPTGSFDQEVVKLDSVYFRGRGAELIPSDHRTNLYVAFFKGFPKGTDVVMHKDPRKEYGNKVPVYLERIRFDLKAGEAVIRFRKHGKVGYYKLKELSEKPVGEAE